VRLTDCVLRNALVLYNAVQAAENAGQVGLHLRLVVGGNQLAPLCHTAAQHRVLAMPGQNVLYVPGKITLDQVSTHRPSYINAILIQRAGILVPNGCNRCRSGAGFTPFPECRYIPGEFGNACGNCKWRDHAARCRHPGTDDNGDDPDEPPRRRRRIVRGKGKKGSSQDDAQKQLPAPSGAGSQTAVVLIG
jgi:hypothetical protein